MTKLSIITFRRSFLVALCLLGITFSSCLRDKKAWDTELAVPLIKANLSLNDLLADSLLVKLTDSSYKIQYEYELSIDSFGNYLSVPDTIQRVSVSLQQLILDDRSLADTVTLREMLPQAGLLDGQLVDLPAQDITDAGGTQEIDVTEEFFSTAKFNKGFLDLRLHNDLPVELEIMIFQLSNKSDGAIIVRDTFNNILPFSSAEKTIDLSGKVVDGVMIGSIVRALTKASDGKVLIEADKGVRIEMDVYDLEPEYATAVFPEQRLVHDTQEVKYNLNGAQVTEMWLRSGNVVMTVHSTIQEDIILDYIIPRSGIEGDLSRPLKQVIRVPAAKPGEKQIIAKEFPLDNYVIQYNGKNPLIEPFVNTVYSELSASIVYSGIERTISLSDSVYIEFGFKDVKPLYAFGDFGKKELSVDQEIDIKVFDNIKGDITFDDIRLGVIFDNAFGIEALVTLNELLGVNTRDNTSVALTSADLIATPILLERAKNPPFTPYKKPFMLSPTNSNINEFVENMPNRIKAKIDLVSRPNGSNDLTDFVFDYSYLRALLTLHLPLTTNFGDLAFVQKQAFNFTELENHERIKSGVLSLRSYNSFPFEAAISLEFLDADEAVLLNLLEAGKNTVAAGMVPAGKERVEEAEFSIIQADLTAADVEMLRNAKKVRITATLNSPDANRYKIFEEYSINTQLSADFVYEQNL